jgi:hypothetical protein
MAQNIGTLIAATARTTSDQDRFPVAIANECKGGSHTVNSVAQRDAIFIERREWGMIAIVSNIAETKAFCLQYNHVNADISNNLNWVEIPGFSPLTLIDGGLY